MNDLRVIHPGPVALDTAWESRGRIAYDALAAVLRSMAEVTVAFSGGVDSAVVLAVASRELGEKCRAVIGRSQSLAASEHEDALAIAREIGVSVTVLDTQEIERPEYRANDANRCYYCKDTLYGALAGIRASGVLVDGTHVDDLGDDRPGRRAAEQYGVRSPLIEAGLGKADVRAMARVLGLRVWDKPAMACLASRVVRGVEVTKDRLSQVERAEALLRQLGFRQFRVRSHGTLARIEVFPEDMPRFADETLRAAIVDGVRAAGFQEVTLDLAGLREGLRA